MRCYAASKRLVALPLKVQPLGPRLPSCPLSVRPRIVPSARLCLPFAVAGSRAIVQRSLGASASSDDESKKLNFDDVRESFAIKTDWEVARALMVFKLCSYPWVVKNAKFMLDVSKGLVGEKLWRFALQTSFFGHFCAGETPEDVNTTMKKLARSGLRAVLDYAAEADVEPQAQRPREGIISARTYDYAGEAECDANAKICLSCIETAGQQPGGFAAIKLTALGKPELLEHLSKLITYTRDLFVEFSLGKRPTRDYNYMDQRINYDQFKSGLTGININLGEEKTHKLFSAIDADKSGAIDLVEWLTFLDPRQLGGLNPRFQSQGLPTLSEQEHQQLEAMISRVERLAEAAVKHKVRLMVDAEQTYFQPAIDHMVLHLQRLFNRQFPTIFNTYQCYLKDTFQRVRVDIERSRREGFLFAAKSVRGAYMVQERKRAIDMNYEDPIQPNIDATHDSYAQVVSLLLTTVKKQNASIMVASHNEHTIRSTTQRMRELSIPRNGGGVVFGQLLGMCDHVSFSLGHCGYQAYKYVPYGPIHEVLPYLLRRAEENSGMLGNATKERALYWAEFKRRAYAKVGLDAD